MIAGKRVIFFSITCLGMSSLITQIVTLREFMNILAGNELVLGMVLGIWLLLTGVGTFAGRWAVRIRKPLVWLVAAQVAIALLPLVHISIIRLLNTFFLPGLMLGLNATFLLTILILFPYCLVSGFLLTLFSGIGGDRRDAAQIGEVYVLDVIGDIIGGVVFSFLLVYFLSSYQTLLLLMLLNLWAAGLVCLVYFGKRAAGAIVAILACAVTAITLADLEMITARVMFPGQQVLSQQSTPYGHLVVTESDNQVAVYANGIVAGSTGDVIAAEESVHYALSQHPEPDHILLVSGGLNGGLREAAKYPAQRIDYVELDPALIELVRQYAMPAKDERIALIAEDARRHLRSKSSYYDAVLIDLADPSTVQLNRFYTIEFFAEVRNALKKGGILSLNISGAENYANPEISYLAATVYQSLAAIFPHILLIPGEKHYFIAGDRLLDYNIAARLSEKNIATSYVTGDYLRARLTGDRIRGAEEMVRVSAGLNEDFRPTGYFILIRYWLTQFQDSLVLPLLLMGGMVLGIVYLLAAAPGRSAQIAVCASGFTGLGLEVVLIVAFQVCYGYVYQQMGVIITGFLLGTALGGAWSVRRASRAGPMMFRLDLLLATAALGLALLLPVVRDTSLIAPGLVSPALLFAGLTGLIGFLVGAQFPVAARLTFQQVERTAGNLYTLDYLGAALGGLVISTFAIPLLGITATCYLLGGVKLATSGLLWLRRNEAVPLPNKAVPGQTHGVGAFSVAATLFVFITLGFVISTDASSTALYSISFLPLYHWALLLLAAVGIVQAMEMDIGGSRLKTGGAISRSVFRHTWIRLSRWVYFAAFSLVVFFPLFRCYFKVPYLFCHVCPRQCVFGYLRPYLVPAALIMNLEKRHWCVNCCPLGTMFDCQAQAAGSPRRLPKMVRRPAALAILGFTVYSYFRIKADFALQAPTLDDWYTVFFANVYAPVAVVLAAAAILIVMSFRIRRPFCDTLCPVGALSDLVLQSEQKLAAQHDGGAKEGIMP